MAGSATQGLRATYGSKAWIHIITTLQKDDSHMGGKQTKLSTAKGYAQHQQGPNGIQQQSPSVQQGNKNWPNKYNL